MKFLLRLLREFCNEFNIKLSEKFCRFLGSKNFCKGLLINPTFEVISHWFIFVFSIFPNLYSSNPYE